MVSLATGLGWQQSWLKMGPARTLPPPVPESGNIQTMMSSQHWSSVFMLQYTGLGTNWLALTGSRMKPAGLLDHPSWMLDQSMMGWRTDFTSWTMWPRNAQHSPWSPDLNRSSMTSPKCGTCSLKDFAPGVRIWTSNMLTPHLWPSTSTKQIITMVERPLRMYQRSHLSSLHFCKPSRLANVWKGLNPHLMQFSQESWSSAMMMSLRCPPAAMQPCREEFTKAWHTKFCGYELEDIRWSGNEVCEVSVRRTVAWLE